MSGGFIFTMDAVLALIPVFIILASVSGLTYDASQFHTVILEKQAQDAVEILSLGSVPLLEDYIDENFSVAARRNIESALNNTVTYSFMLMYNSTTTSNWTFVAGRCNSGNQSSTVQSSKNNAPDVYVAERIIYRNNTHYNFRIYLWVE